MMEKIEKQIEELRDALPMMRKRGSIDEAANGTIHDSLNVILELVKNHGVSHHDSNRFVCQVLRDDEVIETRISQDESDINNWIFTFKEVYSKYGKQIKYQKGVLTDC